MLRLTTPAPADSWGPLPPHSVQRQPARARLRWLERLLFTIAAVALGYVGYAHAESYLYQRIEERELNAVLQSRPVSDVVRRTQPAPGTAIGRISIERLGVSAIVRAGSDARTLSLAVGHVPGTAFPGEDGNVGLAGHRDTFFRRLKDIETGDAIVLATPEGSFTYRVQRTVVVEPTDVWVLDSTSQPALTLVTCYPFSYIGSAPQRFIVRAILNR